MVCGSSKYIEADQEHDTSTGPQARKHLTYPSSVKGKKAFARDKLAGTFHSHFASSRFSSLVEKLTSLSSFPPFSSVHDSNQTNNPSFEFSASSKVEKISKNGRIEERSFEGLNLGNKELLQASEVPIQAQDGRCDELILLTLKGKNEGGTTEGDAKEKMEALFLSLH